MRYVVSAQVIQTEWVTIDPVRTYLVHLTLMGHSEAIRHEIVFSGVDCGAELFQQHVD
ncbi:MAG: hypothetical protein JWM11_4358 [Planctomycetaceae bacterium]|nr:hypothetical protein [Planctomycetaceae bacterium]